MTEKEFNAVFKKLHSSLVYFAKGWVGDFYAEDIVADVFLKLWELKNEENLNVKTYLYIAVKGRCKSFLVGRYKQYQSFNGEPADDLFSDEYADSRMMKAELLRIIIEKVEQLPPVRKKIFDLLYITQIPVNEIAVVMGITESTIRVQKQRIDQKFKVFGVSVFPKNCWLNDRGVIYKAKRYKK